MKKLPNPENDPITAIFFRISNEKAKSSKSEKNKNSFFYRKIFKIYYIIKVIGIILNDPSNYDKLFKIPEKMKIYYSKYLSLYSFKNTILGINELDELIVVKSESELLISFILLVFKVDPDIIAGYYNVYI